MIKVGLGQDSHAFDFQDQEKKLILGGVVFEDEPPLKGNSDADVVLHSLINALSGISGVNVLGRTTDRMCRQGITDSSQYLKVALQHLAGYRLLHVSVSIEGARPHIAPRIEAMKGSLAKLLQISRQEVGITATSGETLTSFGRGEGIQALTVVTASKILPSKSDDAAP